MRRCQWRHASLSEGITSENGQGAAFVRLFSSITFAASAIMLSSCASLETRPNQGPCPAAGSLYEAQRLVELNGEGEQYSDILYTGEINDVRLFCRYIDDDPIEAQIEIDFAFGKGAAAPSDAHQYQYFVAVTRTNRAVIDKQVFPIDVKFPNNKDTTEKTELVGRVVIPRADSSISGANFEILVGFELTDEQNAFNEAGRRYLLQSK